MEPGFILGLWPVSLFLDGTWIYFGSMARIFIFGWNLDLFWVYGPYLYFWMEPGFILGLRPVFIFLGESP